MKRTPHPISSFRADLSDEEVARAEYTRVRSLATWAAIKLLPAFFFIRQRSEFIEGWEAAAAAGTSLTAGVSAGAVGVAGQSAIGHWMMLPNLTDENTRTVLPMNDSLYGAAHIELDRLGPMVVTVPPSLPDDRYWSIAMLDAFLNDFAHLGPKWSPSSGGDFLLVSPGWDGAIPDWVTRVIRAPTNSVVLYHRALVQYEPGDIDVVRSWREGFTFTTLAEREGERARMPDSDDLAHGDLRSLDDPQRYLRLTLAHVDGNPVPVQDSWLIELVRTVAEVPERLHDAVADGFADAQLVLDGAISGAERRDGWTVPFAHTGEQGPYVMGQAVTELQQVGANDPVEAIYVYAERDGAGNVLDASNGGVYELSFPAPPPMESGGFWSLTMYGMDEYLVANPLGRFSTRISRPGFELGKDGSATVTMAAELPAGVAQANWLPAPEAQFMVCLRLYYPGEPIRGGQWLPPPLKRIR